MITEKQINITDLSWQSELVQAITDPQELIELLELDPDLIKPAKLAVQQFPCACQEVLSRE